MRKNGLWKMLTKLENRQLRGTKFSLFGRAEGHKKDEISIMQKGSDFSHHTTPVSRSDDSLVSEAREEKKEINQNNRCPCWEIEEEGEENSRDHRNHR